MKVCRIKLKVSDKISTSGIIHSYTESNKSALLLTAPRIVQFGRGVIVTFSLLGVMREKSFDLSLDSAVDVRRQAVFSDKQANFKLFVYEWFVRNALGHGC